MHLRVWADGQRQDAHDERPAGARRRARRRPRRRRDSARGGHDLRAARGARAARVAARGACLTARDLQRGAARPPRGPRGARAPPRDQARGRRAACARGEPQHLLGAPPCPHAPLRALPAQANAGSGHRSRARRRCRRCWRERSARARPPRQATTTARRARTRSSRCAWRRPRPTGPRNTPRPAPSAPFSLPLRLLHASPRARGCSLECRLVPEAGPNRRTPTAC